MFPEVRWVNGISGHNYINFAYHKALTFGLISGTATYFTILGSSLAWSTSPVVSLINTPSVLGLGAFLSLTFLSHKQIIGTQGEKVSFLFFFFFRKVSLHKTETWR